MTIKDLLNEVINGDDDVEITIKRTVPDDEEESTCDDCPCECKDTCPIDIDDIDDTPLEEKEFKNFKEFIDFLTSIDDEDKDDEDDEEAELKEYEDSAKDAYLKSVAKDGREKADALLKISAAEATIQQAMKEKLPIRDKDVKAYNDALKFLLDRPEFLVALMYSFIDHANADAIEELKK